MITVHNLTNGVAKPVVSSIVYEKDGASKVKPSGEDGWQAYSGKSTITWPSPQATEDSNGATSDVTELTDMSMDNVNRARMVDICIGAGTDDLSVLVAKTGNVNLLSASKFGNWRERSTNEFADVSKRVMLQLDGGASPKTHYNITYGMESLDSVILKNSVVEKVTKLSNAVNDLAAFAGAAFHNSALSNAALTGERMSMYQNMRVMDMSKVTTESNIPNLTFSFRFGQAGIFSGEEEVVKPILALASAFALSSGEGYHSVTGPYPTKVAANREALLETAKIIGGVADELINGSVTEKLSDLKNNTGGTVAGAVSTFNSATDYIYKSIDDIAQRLFSCMRTLILIVGGSVLGPYTVGNIDWEFDFDNVDEYGYPCAGKITYGDLKPIRLYTKSDYARQWGYAAADSSDVTSITAAQLAGEAVEKKITMASVNDKQAEDAGA